MSDVFVDITTTEELVSVNAATTEEVVSVTGQTTEEVVQITIEVMTCTPATILLNGNAFLTVNSGASEDISLLDENGAPVIPVSVVGSTITVPNSGGGGDVTIERSDNSQITIATAPSTFVVPDSDVVLKDSADNVLRTVSVMADSSEDETIGDVTVQLKDSTGANIGGVNNYLAESANNLTAPDATAVIKDSANNELQTVNIASNASQDIIIADTIVKLRDSAGASIGADNNYLAESTNDLTAPDATASLRDSANNVISTTNIRSNATQNITAPDATVTLNGNAFLSPRSNQTVNIILKDENDIQIPPISTTSSEIKVQTNSFWFNYSNYQ